MLLCVASVILGLAFFGPNMNRTTRTLTYSQFRQAWDQGRIVTDDPKRPLKVVTSDTAYDAVIVGWENPPLVEPKDAVKKRSDFQVRVNLDLQGGQIRDNIQAALTQHFSSFRQAEDRNIRTHMVLE